MSPSFPQHFIDKSALQAYNKLVVDIFIFINFVYPISLYQLVVVYQQLINNMFKPKLYVDLKGFEYGK